jgi:hypothetical protein
MVAIRSSPRNSKHSEQCRVDCVKLPPRSPRSKCICGAVCQIHQRVVLEPPDNVGDQSLRRAIREFVTHYHQERNHQGLSNRLIVPNSNLQTAGSVLPPRTRGSHVELLLSIGSLIFTAGEFPDHTGRRSQMRPMQAAGRRPKDTRFCDDRWEKACPLASPPAPRSPKV